MAPTAVETRYCEPIGHKQVDGDYVESWQPHPMSPAALERAREIALAVTSNLGGLGIFGVELFVAGDRSGSRRSARVRTIPAWSP